jgi:hypothetical protein
MVIQRNPDRRRGGVYVLNDPRHAGTHLPAITVVTPAFPRPPPPPRAPQPARHDGTSSRL